MIYLKNQAYPFDSEQDQCDCCDEVVPDQLVNFGDITNFQNIVNVPTFSPQIISNPSFDLGSADWIFTNPFWTISGGQACKVLDTGGSASSLQQTNVFTVGRYYTLTIIVESVSGDDITLDLAGNARTISVPGTYTYNFLASGTGFRASGTDDTLCCINEIRSYEQFPQHVKWIIKDKDGNVVEVLNQEDDPDSFEITDGNAFGAAITGYIDWNDLAIPKGCYKIGVADPNLNTCGQNFVFNGDFYIEGDVADSAVTGWSIATTGTGFGTITDDELDYQSNTAGSTGVVTSLYTKLCAGISYDFEVVVTSVNNVNAIVKGGTVSSPPISSVGTHNFTIVSDGEDLSITFLSAVGAPMNMNIDSIHMELTNESDYTCNAEGPLINLGNHECTHLLNACHNSNVGNFDFTGSFRPMLRLYSKIGKQTYGGTRITARYSNGVSRNTFLDNLKIKQLQISLSGSYVHDFIATLRGYSYTALDNIRIHLEQDEYAPDYGNEENCLAPSTIEFTQDPTPSDPSFIFRDCTGVDKICKTSNLLLLENSDNYVLQTNGGRIILG